MKFMNKALERVGSVFCNSYGRYYTVAEYKSAHNVHVEFECGYTVKTEWKAAKNGSISHPLDKSNYSVGFIGFGNYDTHSFGGVLYKYWRGMLRRCYSADYKTDTYKDVFVCDEWHNFQKFGKWFEDNYKEHMHGWVLDKDLRNPSMRIHSPATCAFIPKEINNFFSRNNGKSKYEELVGLVGVCRGKSNKYTSFCGGKNLGTFSSKESAYIAWETEKITSARILACKFKGLVHNEIYEVLKNFGGFISEIRQ